MDYTGGKVELVKTNYNEIIEISIYILLYSMGEAI